MQPVILRMEGIEKYFPGVHALDHAQLEVREGEVLALVGENGAGKSTLMKILTGVYTKDEGSIELFGEPIDIQSPHDAQKRGISIVHQELNLMPDLTVAENIYIGRENVRGFFLNQREQNQAAKELLQSLHLNIQPRTVVKYLTVAKQQMVEIAKALSFPNTKILVLDEPTAALTDGEIEELFTFIRRLKANGVSVIYISHRMDELKQITDRITVMRDGQFVKSVNTEEVTIDEVVQLMVGRVIYEEPKMQSNVDPGAEVVLEAEHLNSADVKDVSFQLRKGEILGFAGLMGAGRTETARLICGADKRESGVIRIRGKEVRINCPRDSVRAGIGYLSEDRKRYGLCLGLSVEDNMVLPSLERLSTSLFVNDRKLTEVSKEYAAKVRTKTASVKTAVRNLSGGNQQKVVVSKWLLRNCDILIFDEPTRGIDVGGKNEIYKLMNELADEGKSIIMISSELPELLRMSDRIIVMCEGRITGELDIAEANQEEVMRYATKRR